MPNLFLLLLLAFAPPWSADLQKARDAQDRVQLERLAAQASSTAEKQAGDPQAQYSAALADSTLAEVAAEVRDNV